MKTRLFFLSLVISGLFVSCNDEFNLVAPWKDIPIVYGMLSLKDSAVYIRVERAFVDPNANADQVAQIPDSIYYTDAVVSLKRISTGVEYPLHKVDGALEGYPRDGGVIVNSPNYLYKVDSSAILLKGGDEYQLIVKRNGNVVTTANTKVIGNYERLANYPPDNINWNADFIRFGWRSIEKVATFYDLKLILHYDEINPTTGLYESKNLDWILGTNIIRLNDNGAPVVQTLFEQPGVGFYKYLGAHLQGNNPKIFKNLTMVVTCGGPELYDYINVGQANTGLTGTQVITPYTNLTNGGYGILSSRNELISSYGVTQITRDSLKFGQYTKNLNFQ